MERCKEEIGTGEQKERGVTSLAFIHKEEVVQSVWTLLNSEIRKVQQPGIRLCKTLQNKCLKLSRHEIGTLDALHSQKCRTELYTSVSL